MPSIQEAFWKYSNRYLLVMEEADQLYSKKTTKVDGIDVFDQNRGQIEHALKWISDQNLSEKSGLILARYITALTPIGMIRYSVKEKLIPLNEKLISIAQALGWKYLEADAFDGLGILYAYSGYLQEAIRLFGDALDIADQFKDKTRRREFQKHLRKARKQLQVSPHKPKQNPMGLFIIFLYRIRLFAAKIGKNWISEITILNALADQLLDYEKHESAYLYYQNAVTLSRKHAFRLGEIKAAMGLLQIAVTKYAKSNNPISNEMDGVLLSDFEWRDDYSILETLLEIAPAIQIAEKWAIHLANKNDPRARVIFEQLDQIMIGTDEIVTKCSINAPQKLENMLMALKKIKENLIMINKHILSRSSHKEKTTF